MAEFDYWKLLAGLGIFLFGMHLLETSVKDLSGKTFRRIIRDYTSTRIKAIINGTLVTAVLQSSSAVSLMVLAFVGAGIMSMQNAIGVILGSNIGTTLTAWIVATIGFKMKIEAFALPFIGISAFGLILSKPHTKPYYFTCLLIGFGFLFLGLDYMKTSVENFSQLTNPDQLKNMPLVMYVIIGAVLTALMQASAATIAITLAALHSGIMTFNMAAAMVIGANIGTTITVLLGAVGGTPPKKQVAASHLIFNLITGVVAFAGLPMLVTTVKMFVDVSTDGPVGLALFHSLFNVTGVLIFTPFVNHLTSLLNRFFPQRKAVLSVFISLTPPEEVESAVTALKNEMIHLLQECQLYALRSLHIDETLVFDEPLAFEKGKKKKLSTTDLYSSIKMLHSSIIAYYSKIQNQKLDDNISRELEKQIHASRNIMNAAKNFKGINHDLEEFESSDSPFLNRQYDRFRRRLILISNDLNAIFSINDAQTKSHYKALIKLFREIELQDGQFIKHTVAESSSTDFQESELSTLLLVNRLFTQACRMMIFSVKDLMLSTEKTIEFDKTLEP